MWSLPKDSILNDWLENLSITEVPASYQLLGGIALCGALLRRNVWIDQVQWRVYPTVSVMFVGPTGIGKDVIIRAVTSALDSVDPALVIGGKTMEAIHQILLDRTVAGQATCAVIPVPELTAFLGGKDYQKSMVQELTDLLSGGERIILNLRSVREDRIIYQPTITVLAGSTMEWLHRAMPEGALEGGFVPRFLVVHEDYTGRHIPWIKYNITVAERRAATEAGRRFMKALKEVVRVRGEITPLPEAADAYAAWYENRFRRYSPAIRGYANRSRDQVLRIAMISAITRSHNYLDENDVRFAVKVIDRVTESVKRIAGPVSKEAQVAEEILAMLPAPTHQIYRSLARRYTRQQITSAIQLLLDSSQVQFRKNVLHRKEGE